MRISSVRGVENRDACALSAKPSLAQRDAVFAHPGPRTAPRSGPAILRGMTHRGRALVAGVVIAVAALGVALLLSPWSVERIGIAWPTDPGGAVGSPPAHLPLPVLPDTGWSHGGPLTADSLRGSVVVLAVFSDTHPTTFDVLPRIQEWHEAYARLGVRIVGVHAPEYAFATDPMAARRLAARLGLAFPIVTDPALQVLGALDRAGSQVLLALAGPDGRLLAVRTAGNAERDLPAFEEALRWAIENGSSARRAPAATGADASAGDLPASLRIVRLGAASVTEGPLAQASQGRAQPFTAQFRFEVEGSPYVPHPIGWWIPRAQGIEAARGGAAQFLAIRYDASRVGVVVSPPASGPARLWVLRDEKWLQEAALGSDAAVDAHGASFVDVEAPGLYFVARGAGAHVLKLSPETPGLTLHALTFEPEGAGFAP